MVPIRGSLCIRNLRDYVRTYNDMPQVSHHSLYIFYFIWIRSCYAPQLIPWIHYIASKYKHSIKIIQSEQYFSHDTFHDTMSKLLCYIHYNIDDDNYESWMESWMNVWIRTGIMQSS
eukprot:35182_1